MDGSVGLGLGPTLLAVIVINKLDVIFIAKLKSLPGPVHPSVFSVLSGFSGHHQSMGTWSSLVCCSVGPEPHSFGNTNLMLYDQNYQHIPQTHNSFRRSLTRCSSSSPSSTTLWPLTLHPSATKLSGHIYCPESSRTSSIGSGDWIYNKWQSVTSKRH